MNMKSERPYSDPKAAARKIVQIAAATPAVQDGRIYIERVNAPFAALLKGSRGYPEFGAGLSYAIEHGWLDMHESGTYVRLLSPGDNLMSR